MKGKIITYIIFLCGCISFINLAQAETNTDTIPKAEKLLFTKLSFSCAPSSIKDILFQINEREQINFAYSDVLPSLKKMSSIELQDIQLKTLLDSLFSGTEIDYFQLQDFIVLSRKSQLDSLNINENKTLSDVSDLSILPEDTGSYQKMVIRNFIYYGQPENKRGASRTLHAKKRTLTLNVSLKKDIIMQDSLVVDSALLKQILLQKQITDTLKNVRALPQKPAISKINGKVRKEAHYKNFKSKKLSRWSVGVAGGVYKAYWKMEVNDVQHANDLDVRNSYGAPDNAWQAGMSAQYFFNKNFIAESGISFFTFDRQGNHTDFFTNTFANTTTTSSYQYRDVYRYISIPFMLGVRRGNKFFVDAFTGMSFDFLYSSQTPENYDIYENQLYYENQRQPPESERLSHSGDPADRRQRPERPPRFYFNQSSTQEELKLIKTEVRNFNMKLLAKLGLGYKFNKLEVTVSPLFMYMVHPLYKANAPVKEQVWLAGLIAATRLAF